MKTIKIFLSAAIALTALATPDVAQAQNTTRPLVLFDDCKAPIKDKLHPTSFQFRKAPSTVNTEVDEKIKKVPLSTKIKRNGEHALKVTWMSKKGGMWRIGIGLQSPPMTPINIKQYKEIRMWVYSPTALPKKFLPKLDLQEVNNLLTKPVLLANYIKSDLKAKTWSEIVIPVSEISTVNPNIAFPWNKIKLFFLSQAVADGKEHTIYVDDVTLTPEIDYKPTATAPIENTKGYEITPQFKLDITETQYKQLERHFRLKQRHQSWAKYDNYAERNAQIKKRPVAVFMGNSITQGWFGQCPEFFTKNNFVGRGIGGQTTYQMLARFQADVVDLNPKYVVILAGTNDLAQNMGIISIENVVKNVKSMCEIAQSNSITPIVCSMLPVYQYGWHKELGVVVEKVQEYNRQLEAYANSKGFAFANYYEAMADEKGALRTDLTRDGVHTNPAGYAIMESVIMPLIK